MSETLKSSIFFSAVIALGLLMFLFTAKIATGFSSLNARMRGWSEPFWMYYLPLKVIAVALLFQGGRSLWRLLHQ